MKQNKVPVNMRFDVLTLTLLDEIVKSYDVDCQQKVTRTAIVEAAIQSYADKLLDRSTIMDVYYKTTKGTYVY